MQSTIDRINEIVNTTNTTDFRIESLVNDKLLVTGSFDHAYYHELEIRFHGVEYIALPSIFDHPTFSIASAEQRRALPDVELVDPAVLFLIHEDPHFNGGRKHWIVAEAIEITEGTVYYYWRENLKPAERIAEWVERDG